MGTPPPPALYYILPDKERQFKKLSYCSVILGMASEGWGEFLKVTLQTHAGVDWGLTWERGPPSAPAEFLLYNVSTKYPMVHSGDFMMDNLFLYKTQF